MTKTKESLGIKGYIRNIKIIGRDGHVRWDSGWMKRETNLVVTVGLAEIAQSIGNGLGGVAARYIGTGTDNTAAATGQTALLAEVETRADATITNETTSTTNDTARFIGTITMTGDRSLNEFGLFTLSSGGVMYSRFVRASTLSLLSGEAVQVTWDLVVGTS